MMNFFICSLLLLFLRQIFTISSADKISARSQMLFELAIILVIVSVYQHLSARLIYEGMNENGRRCEMKTMTLLGADMFGTIATIFELALLAVKNVIAATLMSFLLPEHELVVETLWSIVNLV